MLNVALLKKVKAHILEEPRRLMMADLINRKIDGFDKYLGDDNKPHNFAKCGTAACIAGWSVLIHDGMNAPNEDLWGRACQILGIPENGWRDNELFITDNWGREADEYEASKSMAGRAKIAAKFIDKYILKYGPKKKRKKAA